MGNYVLNARRILLDTTVPLYILRSPLDFIGMGVISAEKSQGLKRSYLIEAFSVAPVNLTGFVERLRIFSMFL